MELDTKCINVPGRVWGLAFLLSLVVLFFLLLYSSRVCYFFFFLPLPWLIFWVNVLGKYIPPFDTYETTDEGIIIRYKNKNWLTSRINNVSVPWERISQIRAIVGGDGKGGSYSYYFILDNGTLVNSMISEKENKIYGIAEKYALFLNRKYGQNISVNHPPPFWRKDTIIASRIDTIEETSKNIRVSLKHLRLSHNGYLIITILLTGGLILNQIQNPTEMPRINHIIIVLVLLCYGLFTSSGPDENKLRQQYLDFLQNAATETSKTKQEESTHSTGMTE